MTRKITAELVFEAAAVLGEGPQWHPIEHTLDWVDIMAGRLHRYDPLTDSEVVMDVGQPLGAIAPRRAGGYVLALEQGFGILEPTGTSRIVAQLDFGERLQRMNDGKCDSAGRFWAGSMAYDLTPGAGALYRLDADFTVTQMLAGVTISNGLDWTDDDRTMFFIDSLAHGVDAFDFDASSGTIGNRRRVIEIASIEDSPIGSTLPDGMTLDAEGFMWVAVYGASEVRRYSTDGELDCTVAVPACAVTSCAFGGRDLSTLYITSSVVFDDGREPLAGSLFRCEPGICGRPTRLFAG